MSARGSFKFIVATSQSAVGSHWLLTGEEKRRALEGLCMHVAELLVVFIWVMTQDKQACLR